MTERSVNWREGISRLSRAFLALIWLIAIGLAFTEPDPWRALGSTLVYLVVFSCFYFIAGAVLRWILRGFVSR